MKERHQTPGYGIVKAVRRQRNQRITWIVDVRLLWE